MTQLYDDLLLLKTINQCDTATDSRWSLQDQTESLIGQGWRFVGTLPKGKAVIEKNGVRMEPV